MYSISNMILQNLSPNMGMDINNFVSNNVNNCDEIKGYTMISNKNYSRTVSMTSSKVSVDYATKMERLNNISEKTAHKEPIDSLQLSYANNKDI